MSEQELTKEKFLRFADIRDRCIKLFNGSDDWVCVRHPELGYESPWGWIKSGKSIETIEELLAKEEKLLSGK